MARGVFITLEGGEGSGKSTLARGLADKLSEISGQNRLMPDVLLTREPGGSPLAERIRNLLVTGDPSEMDSRTEAMLLFAARRNHMQKTIIPALEAGKWVICDRFYHSSYAYQGYGATDDLAALQALKEFAIGDFEPDLTLLLDIPADVGLARATGRESEKATGQEDRFERFDRAFHERLRQGFVKMAENDRRWTILDAQMTPDALLLEAIAAIRSLAGSAA